MITIFKPFDHYYQFNLLPAYSSYVFDNHLNELCEQQYQLSFEYKVPILGKLLHFSKEQLLEITRVGLVEFLGYLRENKAEKQIEDSLDKWYKDKLEVLGKFEINAEDITSINFIRSLALKKYIPRFTAAPAEQELINSEIDRFFLGSTSSGFNMYMSIMNEKIEAEQALNKGIASAMPGMIYIYDTTTERIVYCNNKKGKLLGFTEQEFLSMDREQWMQSMHPADRGKVNRSGLASTVKEDEVQVSELRLLNKNGSYEWVRIYQTLYKKDEAGGVKQILGVSFNIDREKSLLEELTKKQQQLLEAQSLSHIGNFEWDFVNNTSEGSVEMWNIFEISNAQPLSRFLEQVHPDDRHHVQQAVEEAMKTGQYMCEYRYIVNGKEKTLFTKGTIQFHTSGRPYKMVGIVQDVTAWKRIHKQLEEKTKDLERSNAELKQFASIASYEIKEPVQKIAMFAEMLHNAEKQKLSFTSITYLSNIQNISGSLQKLVDDLLEYSFTNQEQRKENVDLRQLVKETLDLMDQAIQEKNAIVHFTELPQAKVIPSAFRQLFRNLILNSIKYSRQGSIPEVNIKSNWITAPDNSRTLELVVEDNGIGFSPAPTRQVFEYFRYLESAPDSLQPKRLGLSICKKIVELHKGTIEAFNQPAYGSRFVIKIPQEAHQAE